MTETTTEAGTTETGPHPAPKLTTYIWPFVADGQIEIVAESREAAQAEFDQLSDEDILLSGYLRIADKPIASKDE